MLQELHDSDEDVLVPEVALLREEDLFVVTFDAGNGEEDFGMLAFIQCGVHEYVVLGPLAQLMKLGTPLEVRVYRCERLPEDRYNFHPAGSAEFKLSLLNAFEMCAKADKTEL